MSIRLNATADVIRLKSSSAIALTYAITAQDITGATVTDASVSGTNSDTVKNNIITAPSAGHRKDVSKIVVSNANAGTTPRVRVYTYLAAVEVLVADFILLYGQSLQYFGGEWKVVQTADTTAGGLFTRAEAEATYAKLTRFPVARTDLAGGMSKRALIAGGAAGNLTVTGIKVGDELVSVLRFIGTGTAVTDVTDLTSEFTITATNTINNTGGTTTSAATDKLLVIYNKLTA